MRVAAIMWCANIPGLQVYIFRREYADLWKNHMEGPKGFYAMLAPWVGAGFARVVGNEIRFWNGSKIFLCHCQHEKDVYGYQGAEIHVLIIDELTHFTEAMYRFLRNRLRMVGITLPPEYEGKFPRILCGANPGNIGHLFVKTTFVTGTQPYKLRLMPAIEGGMLRQYIPALLDDNPSLLEDDPGYEDRLQGLGSATLVKAMRYGDWDVVEGAFFDCWSSHKHVLAPFAVPDDWLRFRSGDWGSNSPYSIQWWAVVQDDFKIASDGDGSAEAGIRGVAEGKAGALDHDAGGRRKLPRGALVCYREDYGKKGGKLTAEQVAERIIDLEKEDPKLGYGVLDPSAFKQDGGPSIAERINTKLIQARPRLAPFREADNSRVARAQSRDRGGPMGGWDQLRGRMVGVNGVPMIYWFSTCFDSIRTIPVLQHDAARAEDLDCWVAGTMVSTPQGDRPIENIQVGDLVDTPIGPRQVLKSYLSGTGGTAWAELSNGVRLEGTPHHKIYIRGKGLIELENARCHDMPIQRTISWQRKLLSIAASLTRATTDAITITRTGQFLPTAARAFIGRFGWMLGVRFRLAGMSITLMRTTTTTSSATSSACHLGPTAASTSRSGSLASSEKHSQPGAQARSASERCAIMPERCTRGRRDASSRAAIVAVLLKLDHLSSCIARLNAPRSLAESSFGRIARFAGLGSGRAAAPQRKSAPVHIAAVGRCDVAARVYNLTVADAHLFYANGILSSNTNSEDHAADSARYGVMSRPWLRSKPEKEIPKDSYAPPSEQIPDDNWKTM